MISAWHFLNNSRRSNSPLFLCAFEWPRYFGITGIICYTSLYLFHALWRYLTMLLKKNHVNLITIFDLNLDNKMKWYSKHGSQPFTCLNRVPHLHGVCFEFYTCLWLGEGTRVQNNVKLQIAFFSTFWSPLTTAINYPWSFWQNFKVNILL